jgi:FMN reductase
MTVITVVGNPRPRSRTRRAAHIVAAQLTGREPDLALDLADLGADLLDPAAPTAIEAVAAVTAAELVVVASPTYKASYTGLLKLFLDRFAAGSLNSVVAVPVMLGGDWRHSLAPEVFLKPVLAELGASLPTRGLFLLDREADSDWRESDALSSWLDRARTQLPASLVQS